jgi:hypothetical protein
MELDSPLHRLVHHGVLGDLEVDLKVARFLPRRLGRALLRDGLVYMCGVVVMGVLLGSLDDSIG